MSQQPSTTFAVHTLLVVFCAKRVQRPFKNLSVRRAKHRNPLSKACFEPVRQPWKTRLVGKCLARQLTIPVVWQLTFGSDRFLFRQESCQIRRMPSCHSAPQFSREMMQQKIAELAFTVCFSARRTKLVFSLFHQYR